MRQISSQCDVLYIKYLDFSNQQDQFSLIIHPSTHPSTHLSSHPAICPLCIFQFFIHNLSLAVWIVRSHISRAQVLVPNQLEHWRLLALIKDMVLTKNEVGTKGTFTSRILWRHLTLWYIFEILTNNYQALCQNSDTLPSTLAVFPHFFPKSTPCGRHCLTLLMKNPRPKG